MLLKSYFDFFFQRVRMTAAGPKMLKLEVPGLAENRPSVLKGDKIYAQVYTGNSSKTEPVEYEGYVHQIEDSAIIVGFSKRLRDKFVANMQFNIRFTFNRFPNRNMHRASEFISHNPEFTSFVFPQLANGAQNELNQESNVRFFDSKIEQNKEQKLAVMSIVK